MLLADRQYLNEERMQAMLVNLLLRTLEEERGRKRKKRQLLSLTKPFCINCILNINVIINRI